MYNRETVPKFVKMTTSTISAVAFNFVLLVILNLSITGPVLSNTNLNTLQQAHIYFRHGARTMDKTYSTDPYKNVSFWEPGYSQLNNLGKLQAYNLGQFLRDRYNGFVKDTYDLKDIHVLSSDLTRTIQTAYAVMAGFYLPNPPLENVTDYLTNNSVEIPLPWKSVPVHNIPQAHDNLIRQPLLEICPRYRQCYERLPREEEEIEKLFQDNRKTLSYFFNETDLDYYDYHVYNNLVHYLDTLFLETYYNMTLPAWTDELFATDNATNFFYKMLEMITYTDEMKRLRGGPILERLVQNMVLNESALNEFDRNRSGRKKIYFFSAHDITLVTLLNTLGIFNKRRPPYTSAVILELHRLPKSENEFSTSEQLHVEIYFRNETDHEPYQLKIPGCDMSCPLEDFIKITQPLIPVDWNLECQAVVESSSLSAGWIIFIVLCVWVVLFAVLQFWIRSSCFTFLNKNRKDEYSYIT